MWETLKGNEHCSTFRDALEETAAKFEDAAPVETLIARLSDEQREHVAACADCRQAASELVKVKELFNGAASFAEEDRPWFASRVMAVVASREREFAERVTAWTEFPRFASRLTWVAAILLLAGTTWFYESVVRAPSYVPSGQESIFEVPQQTTPDDVLVSMAGDHP